ncbi:predicted protein [Lichtheimia corymbifera JMRC:FSU:9682]|uniref:Uncharacterized protein n=1 Tax=Lichtheimia corymbifera JMRC:FSU:9682 TaxID=1263082 RepID=A0A068S2B6_9FUNG|nr:predicted protein [Lichtheimia corymbifera JMRC:FSU:9682]
MVRHVMEYGKQESKQWPFRLRHHSPCVGHIFNLAIQAILKNGLKAQAPENVIDHDNEDHHTSALAKLRKGILKIRSSPQRYATFERKRTAMECPPLNLIVLMKEN